MNSNSPVSQEATLGAHDNTFVAQQNNYGLSATAALDMALQLFREYYPQLRQEALDNLYKLVQVELSKIKSENIISPSPRIAVPTLQAASIAEEADIRQLYAKMLARAMDKETYENIHPAYIRIIDEMNAFDTLIMKKIHEIHDSIPVARVTFIFDSKYLLNGMPRFYSPYFDGLGDEFKISKSIENLGRLQLINIFEGTVTTYDYENFKSMPYVVARFEEYKRLNKNLDLKLKVDGYVIQTTDFGNEFMNLCIQ